MLPSPAPGLMPLNPAATALQHAAGLVGNCPGRVNLTIEAGGYEITIRQAEARDTRDDAHDRREAGTEAVAGSKPAAGAAGGPTRNQLLHVLFSADERSILRALAAHQPSKASDVHDRCRAQVEKSKFWVLWSNLQHRLIVDDAQDDQVGFVIRAPWVLELLAEKPASSV